MSIGHVVSRTVRDSAAFLDATHGPAAGDPYHAPAFDGSYLAQCAAAPRRLRIAFDTTPLTGVPTHPDCIEAVRSAAARCESLGHSVEEASPQFDRLMFRMATGVVVSANVANSVDARLAVLGRKLSNDDVESNTRATVEYGRSIAAPRYAAAMQTIHQTGRAVARFHQTYDVMLTPVSATPPLLAERWSERTWTANVRANVTASGGFSGMWNVAGYPPMTVPFGVHPDTRTPIGVQLAAPSGSESLLLGVAALIERLHPWPRAAPGWD